MKKTTGQKIILGATIFIFAMFFLQVLIPQNVSAVSTVSVAPLPWDNPNSSNASPYKFKVKDFLNSDMIMQVIGCTGIVDKVVNKVTTFITDRLNGKKDDASKDAEVAICDAIKGTALTTSATALNTTLSTAINYILNCKRIQPTEDTKQIELDKKREQREAAAEKRNQCLNGIAYTLAKNQLTAITRNTVNWVNSGFKGDPLYVRNINSLQNSIEKTVLELEVNRFSDRKRAYPYGSDFARTVINNYKDGTAFRNGVTNVADGLTSNLEAFLRIKPTYDNTGNYDNTGTYGGEQTEDAQQRAQRLNDYFAKDFHVGGWDGYLALTQIDQNNPLGFTMRASQSLADQEKEKIENTKQELTTNGGFLNQKQCVLWQLYDENGKPRTTDICEGDGPDCVNDSVSYVYSKNRSNMEPNYDKCVKEETVTPGQIIKDKISMELGSPERQLELADDINKVLNSLFSMLIDKLQNQGLAGLSSEQYAFSSRNMSVGSDFTNSSTSDLDPYSSGQFTNGTFDLTRDLGNKYTYDARESLGNWNAQNNTPGLYPNTSPIGKANVFYTVSIPGNTKLIDNGFNGWAVGDRAFWNGKTWQNWKKGEANPIKERGIIQIQKDYVVAAKELLKLLPTVMPKLGELDYCIPGPNPSWETNSLGSESLFQEYANSLYAKYTPSSGLNRDKSSYSIAKLGDPEFDNYKKSFSWTTPVWWQRVINTEHWNALLYLGTLDVEKKDKKEAAIQQKIESELTKISYDFDNFKKIFNEQMSYLYGKKSLMLKPFLEREDTGELIDNTAYLPMAETGLNITKYILAYDEDINTATTGYQDAIVQANANTYKLDAIRKRVNGIIKEAQDRRDALLLEILNQERKDECEIENNDCLKMVGFSSEQIKYFTENGGDGLAEYCLGQYNSCISDTMTMAEYKEKYKDCLAEENITYFDEGDIMGGTGEVERCENKLDDDLDGFVDLADPDCSGYINGEPEDGESDDNSGISLYGCKISETPGHPSTHEDSIKNCYKRTALECTQTPYYSNNWQYTCEYLPV